MYRQATRISHEHCVNLSTPQKERNVSKKQLSFQVYTVFMRNPD